MSINMGMGRLGDDRVIHKRKFRWTFHVVRQGRTSVPASFVKVAARPNLNIEETEINFLNAKRFIPGKGTWETITVTYYDVAIQGGNAEEANLGLFNWLADVYDYTGGGTNNPNPDVKQSAKRSCYGGTGVLQMYDGCGNGLEQWRLIDCWPQAVNFGDLDYSVSEEATIEITLRYGGVTYQSYCPSNTVKPECCGCDTGLGGAIGVSQS
jgi:hypothetical protein